LGCQRKDNDIMPLFARVKFNGIDILTAKHKAVIYVSINPICVEIGLDWKRQKQIIEQHPLLSLMELTGWGDGDSSWSSMLPIRLLQVWLFGLPVSDRKAGELEKLRIYQQGFFDVVNDFWISKPLSATEPSEFEIFLELTRGRSVGKREASTESVSMTTAKVLQYLYRNHDNQAMKISARQIGRELFIDHRTVRRVVDRASEWNFLTKNNKATELLSVSLHKEVIDESLDLCRAKLLGK